MKLIYKGKDVYKVVKILTAIALAVIILLKLFKIVDISEETLMLSIIGAVIVFAFGHIAH